MVAPAVRAPLVIGLDVGGTKILSDLVDREGAIVALHEEPSPGESEEEVLGALDAAVEALLDDRGRRDRLRHPGQPRRGTRRILNGMNLPLDDVNVRRSRTSRDARVRRSCG